MVITFRKLAYSSLFFIFASSCSAQDSPDFSGSGASLQFPLFKGCERTIKNDFDKNASKIKGFQYSIKKFDITLISHPEIVGYVEMSVDAYGEEFLKAIANGPILDCYPNSSFSVNINEPNFSEDLTGNIEFEKRRVPNQNFYPTLKNDELTVFFNEK